MAARAVGPTRGQRCVRSVLVVGYVLVVVALPSQLQPRIFWTILLPLLPLSIVLMGFANWRRICPLAFFGELGRLFNRGTQRRVPGWFEKRFFPLTFGVLLLMLVVRLLGTNGDAAWLSALLVGLALAAALTNWVFTGKTWCNFFCPVALVERIYTEPNSLLKTSNSQCIRCTACKKDCPDIDQENAYWRDLSSAGRRLATYAFPGLVLSFYVYYWLRAGDWEAYFDGRWTRLSVDSELVLGAGFFFARQVPALLAAPITLAAFSVASLALFLLLESSLTRVVAGAERRRHLVLTIAAFSAFSIFYFFAGAPTLRLLPGATRTLAFAAPLLATLFAVKRWHRTHERFIREKSASRLLRNWPFDDPPPQDPAEVYAWIKAGEHAREQHLAAYSNTIREMIADGLVRGKELRLLEEVRKQLGISRREHDKILERLSEEERQLFETEAITSIEERVQLDGYQTALAEALLRHASASEIAELQRAFGVSPETHTKLLAKMRGESGALLLRARGQMEHVRETWRDLAQLGLPDQSGASGLLSYLLHKEQEAGISRVLEFFEIAGDAEQVRMLRPKLFSGETESRRAALAQLADACPSSRSLIYELEPMIIDPIPARRESDPVSWQQMLKRRAAARDPHVRAAAMWVAGGDPSETIREVVAKGLDDPHPLVRETAALSWKNEEEKTPRKLFTSLSTIEKMQFLRSVPLFAQLDPEDLHDLARLTQEEVVRPPEVVCEQGDIDPDALYIIVDGLASVILQGKDESGKKTEREVAVLGAGEVVGELSLLDGSPRLATVRPKQGPIKVLRIPAHLFRSRLLERPRVSQPLLVTLAGRLRDVTRRVIDAEP